MFNKKYMDLAEEYAEKYSEDPNTKVGCTLVCTDGTTVLGCNNMPEKAKVKFPWERTGDFLKTKYPFVIHAEMNAIANCVKNSDFISPVDAKVYVTLFPCSNCAKLLISAGIKKVYYKDDKYKDTDDVKASKMLFDACGIEYEQYS